MWRCADIKVPDASTRLVMTSLSISVNQNVLFMLVGDFFLSGWSGALAPYSRPCLKSQEQFYMKIIQYIVKKYAKVK